MKRYLYYIFILLSVCACEKDGEKLILSHSGELSGFKASSENIVLNASEADNLALTLYWKSGSEASLSDPEVGIPDGLISTAVQFSLAEDFSSYSEEEFDASLSSVQFTVERLNTIVTKLGLAPDTAGDVFVRIAQKSGNVLTYSEVLRLSITPYSVDSSYFNIVDKDNLDNVTGTIYRSASSPDRYEGFVTTSSGWYNFFFIASDGTQWGTEQVNWTAFSATSDNPGNCWFGDTSGNHYLYLDTKAGEWGYVHCNSVDAYSPDNVTTLKYSKNEEGFTGTITTTSDNVRVTLKGIGNRYDITTGDKASVESPFCLAPQNDGTFSFVEAESVESCVTVAKAGTYKLTLKTSDKTWTLTETSGEGPVVVYPETMNAYYYQKEQTAKLNLASVLYPVEDSDGIYEGFIYTDPDWGNSYSNFRFHTPDDSHIYGTEDQYGLSESGWNMWSSHPGMNYVNLNLAEETWDEIAVTQVAISGDFNGWSIENDIFAFDLDSGKWVAECNISDIGWGFKFVLGDSGNTWRWKYADTDGDGVLNLCGDGDNIVPASAGRYKIVLDLTDFSAPTYTMTLLD